MTAGNVGGRARKGEGRLTRLPSSQGGGYRLHVSLGVGPDGTRVRRMVTARTLKELHQKRDALAARWRAGQLSSDPAAARATLREYLTGWLEDKRREVEPSTWKQYQAYATKHLIPLAGAVRLAELSPQQVRQVYRQLAQQLAPRSVLHAHRVLSQALKRAVGDGLIPRNPCQGVSPGKVPRSEVRALTGDEARRLLATASGDWHALWLTGLTTGMRLGELLGLTWPDVDLEHGSITVQRALVDGEDGALTLRPYPKSRSGVRTIPLPADTVDALREHRQRQRLAQVRAPEWTDASDLVFLSRVGTPLLEGNVIRALRRHGEQARIVGRVHPHLLRHTYASQLLAANRPIPEVSYLLGHASSAVTLTIYAHYVRSDLGEARDAIARAYGLA